MARFLLPSTPLYGHLSPMLSIGRALVKRGHQVTVLTGRKYRQAVELSGLEFWPLPAEVDYDDADLDTWLPGRTGKSGLSAGRHDVIGLFVRPIVAQHRALIAALEEGPYDAVVAESAFLGALPLVLADRPGKRVPVVGVSVTPLAVPSVDCAPFGSALDPGTTPGTRRRNRLLNTVLRWGPLRPIQREVDEALTSLGLPPGTVGYFDHVTAFDQTFHLAVPGIEYPRRELPATVHLVGPVRPELTHAAQPNQALPDWWDDLDDARPVVHVTQGTMDNTDFSRLAVPAVSALADGDVWVVVSTGGRDTGELSARLGRPLPANVRVAPFLPYRALLPRTDVMVTNGGFGGVQQALAYGVPLVVAGATEDKPEVAARVAWSRSGIDLRTGTPTPTQVGAAVRTVLAEPSYRAAAAGLQLEIVATGDPVVTIIKTLEQLSLETQTRESRSGGSR